MTNDKKRYNGYANYETWYVSLWLSNDQGMYDHIQKRITGRQDKHATSQYIKEYIEELNPLSGEAGLFADLMNAALDEVDWVEVAESLLEE